MTDERQPPGSSHGIDVSWRTRERARRGPRPALSVDKIVEAAIVIADDEGIDAVSMQRVATGLGFTTMSLYRYLSGKDQLVEAMLDAAVGEPPELDPGAPWDVRVERWVNALWASYRRHPWMLQVPLTGPPLGPNELAWFDAALRSFDGSGLADGEAMAMSLFLGGAVRGLAGVTADFAQALESSGEQVTYSGALRALLDEERHPALCRLTADGAFDTVESDEDSGDATLEFGVRQLLAGLRAHVAARGGEAGG